MKKENFIKFFIKKRKLLGYSQNKIANEIGISVQAVSNWERGISFPDLSYLDDIAKLLDTNVESLITGKEKKIKIKDDIQFNTERFSFSLSKLRKSKSLTQSDLGKILGISGQNISKFENGVFLPSIEVLEKYSKYFDISFLNLYYGLDDNALYETKEIKSKSNKLKWLILLPFAICIIISLILFIPFSSNKESEYKVLIDGIEQTYYYGDVITLVDKEDTETEVFIGYYDELGNKYSGDIEVTDNLTLISKYLKKYKITLDLDGGVCENNTVDVVYSRNVELPNPTKDEYIFMGWYINDEIYENGFIYDFKEDITLKARYISVTSAFLYEVTNDGLILTSYRLDNRVVVIPETIEGVEIIGVRNTLLNGRTRIREVVFPSSIVTFEDGILAGQNYLEKITIATDANTTIKKLFNVSTSSELPQSFDTIEFNKVTKDSNKLFVGNINTYNIILPNDLETFSDYFKECTYIKTINIPNSAKSIDDYAFSGCSNLISVTIRNNVTSVGSYAFYNCSSLTSITIPGNVISIGGHAFEGCGNLISIKLPSSLTSIGEYVFQYCSSLTSITIPEGVTSISDHAFSSCSSLTSITIPNGVTRIGSNAFYSCNNLRSILIPEGIISISAYTFYNCKNLINVTIPASVKSIDDYAFCNCSSLTSITIPNDITSIGSYAFSGCYGLVEVINKSALNIIKGSDDNGYVGRYALQIITDEKDSKTYKVNDCILYKETDKDIKLIKYIGNDTNLVIPNEVTSISGHSFTSVITSITIPVSVKSVGNNAFNGCNRLTNVYYEGTIEDWCNIIFKNANSNPMRYANNFFIFSNERNGFEQITELEIPETITKIGDYQFYRFKCITSVIFSNSVTRISSYAFYNCSGIISIIFPDSVTSIGKNAFSECSNLTSVTVSKGVTSIDDYAFYNCHSLVEVINKSSLDIVRNSSAYGYIGCYAFQIITAEKYSKLSLDNDLVIYKESYSDRRLVKVVKDKTNVVIPGNVSTICRYAFSECSLLTNVSITKMVSIIEQYSFYNCTNLTNIYYNGTIDQWNEISKVEGWDYNTGQYVIHCTDGDIDK